MTTPRDALVANDPVVPMFAKTPWTAISRSFATKSSRASRFEIVGLVLATLANRRAAEKTLPNMMDVEVESMMILVVTVSG